MFEKIKNVFVAPKTQPEQTIYQALGEEKGVYELVKKFYEVMESDPKAKECLATHDLINGLVPDEVKKKLFMFLCGWFGGPNLFVEAYGNPAMRARHARIKVTEKEKDQWLYCINTALDSHPYKISKRQKEGIKNSFWALASRIQNS